MNLSKVIRVLTYLEKEDLLKEAQALKGKLNYEGLKNLEDLACID